MYSIAIVDDNEAWNFTLGYFLHQHGFSVSSFGNPELFLRQAQEFDLALVDFSIPSRRYQKEIDGPGLIKRLKQQLDQPPLFVLISAYFTEEILTNSDNLCPDADACLSKSAELREILKCIEHLLKIDQGSSDYQTSHKVEDRAQLYSLYRGREYRGRS